MFEPRVPLTRLEKVPVQTGYDIYAEFLRKVLDDLL